LSDSKKSAVNREYFVYQREQKKSSTKQKHRKHEQVQIDDLDSEVDSSGREQSTCHCKKTTQVAVIPTVSLLILLEERAKYIENISQCQLLVQWVIELERYGPSFSFLASAHCRRMKPGQTNQFRKYISHSVRLGGWIFSACGNRY
jgi:hypothetical protein